MLSSHHRLVLWEGYALKPHRSGRGTSLNLWFMTRKHLIHRLLWGVNQTKSIQQGLPHHWPSINSASGLQFQNAKALKTEVYFVFICFVLGGCVAPHLDLNWHELFRVLIVLCCQFIHFTAEMFYDRVLPPNPTENITNRWDLYCLAFLKSNNLWVPQHTWPKGFR